MEEVKVKTLYTVVLTGTDGCTYSFEDTEEAYNSKEEAQLACDLYNEKLEQKVKRRAELSKILRYDEILTLKERQFVISENKKLFDEWSSLSGVGSNSEYYEVGEIPLKRFKG